MNKILSDAYDYAIRLGISPSLTGFHYFAQAVVEYVTRDDLTPLEEVCEKIGKRYSTQTNTVMHAISYALKTAKNVCEKIYEYTGDKATVVDVRPKFVICLIAQNVRHDQAEFA